MSAPLYDGLQRLASQNTVRFHMPGHKGRVLREFPFSIDYTETYETGDLYQDEGIIHAAEQEAAVFYHAPDCLFLTGGSSQGVLSLLATACGIGTEILVDRNCHRSVCHALALLDLTPHFLQTAVDSLFGFCRPFTAEQVEQALREHPNCRAFFLTSPTYYGVRQPIAEIAAVCRAHQIPLLVDCAHGAHFPAIALPTPLEEGASACVMSAHKTLPVLGQGALLLSDSTLDHHELRESSRLFGTTSPSYPILASIDLAREQINPLAWQETAQKTDAFREQLFAETPFLPLTQNDYAIDSTRLTICTAGTELSGHSLADRLYDDFGIAVEMADSRNIVCIVTPFDLSENLTRLHQALVEISASVAGQYLPQTPPSFPLPRRLCSVRTAWFAPRESVALENAVGRICARPVTPYPPGVPVIFPGEEISLEQIEFLQRVCYNDVCAVIK